MPDKPTYDELVTALREYREACCAAMRVLADIDTGQLLGMPADTKIQRFADECHAIGLVDGFGKRNDDILKRALWPPRS